MNDKNIADYDQNLDMLNQNIKYMDRYPDWAQAAEPRKLTGEEYLQRKVEEAMSPMAVEANPTMSVADPDEGIHRSR